MLSSHPTNFFLSSLIFTIIGVPPPLTAPCPATPGGRWRRLQAKQVAWSWFCTNAIKSLIFSHHQHQAEPVICTQWRTRGAWRGLAPAVDGRYCTRHECYRWRLYAAPPADRRWWPWLGRLGECCDGGTIASVVPPPPPRHSVAVCSTASVGCINHNVWRIYACYLYRAVFTLYRKKIIESSRGLLACELVSFAALLHKLYFIIFTAMLSFLSWLWWDHLSYLNTLGMIGSTYLADNVSFIDTYMYLKIYIL